MSDAELPGEGLARYRRGDLFSTEEEAALRGCCGSGEWIEAVKARNAVIHSRFNTIETDVELAAKYRDRMLQAVQPVIDLANEARAKGLIISFTFAPVDAFGRVSLASVDVVKKLA